MDRIPRSRQRRPPGYQAIVGSIKSPDSPPAPYTLPLPAGFRWNPAYNLPIVRNPGGWALPNPVEYARRNVDPNIFTVAPYYVDVASGSDSNTGLTAALAVKSISKAIQLGNADAQPAIRALVANTGRYDTANNITGSTTNVRANKSCGIIGTGSTPTICTSGNTSTSWADDGTGNNTYTATISNFGQPLDLSNPDVYGRPAEMTHVADAATCRTTPNSWAHSGTTVSVHRTNGDAVTDANTLSLLYTNAACFDATTKDVYLENIECWGGRFGAIDIADLTVNITRNASLVFCNGLFAGQFANAVPGIHIDRMSGLVVMVGCKARQNSSDGINLHANGNAACFAVTVNCSGTLNGRWSSTSNNGLTGHETFVAIDVGGSYGDNVNGAPVHFIQTSQVYCLGTTVNLTANDEAAFAGNSAYKATAPCTMWLRDCTATVATPGTFRSLYSQAGTGNAAILLNNFTDNSAQRLADTACTIGTF